MAASAWVEGSTYISRPLELRGKIVSLSSTQVKSRTRRPFNGPERAVYTDFAGTSRNRLGDTFRRLSEHLKNPTMGCVGRNPPDQLPIPVGIRGSHAWCPDGRLTHGASTRCSSS